MKIAGLLGVNRNTINGDIAYWHSQLAGQISSQSITAKMTRQIQRIDMQRDRLLEFLEDAGFDEKFRIEKFISDIDNRLMQYYSRMILGGKTAMGPAARTEDVNEDEIRGLVRGLVLQEGQRLHSENDLEFYFIRETKCSVTHAGNLLGKMRQDGLGLCRHTEASGYLRILSDDHSPVYDLEEFADLRGYVTSDELSKAAKKRAKLEADIQKIAGIEEKLVQRYGKKSQWPEEILEKFESGEPDDSILLE